MRRAASAAVAVLFGAVLAAIHPGATAGAQESDGGGAAASLLDVPFLPQSELLCGGAAAAMVLRYWGEREVDAGEFRALVRPDEGGIRGEELARELEDRGWRTTAFGGGAGEVRRHVERGRPVIALLEIAPERHHFVVVVSWTDRGIIYHDPAGAPFQVRTAQAFEEQWRPTGRWSLLVLPPASPAAGDGSAEPPPPEADPAPPAAEPSPPEVESPPPEPQAASGDVCEGRIDAAVREAAEGDLAAADRRLSQVLERCPSSGRARVELAGVRVRQGRWDEARRLAGRAAELRPSDPLAWRILATSRYRTGRGEPALDAWNRLGEPTVERIRIEGLGRTRYGAAAERIDLDLDGMLTAPDLRRSRRRLTLLPTARSTRLAYRPLRDGRVEVRADLAQRPVLPTTPAAWAGIALRGAVQRSATVHVAGPGGAGELWTADIRWEENRPGARLGVAVPNMPLLPGAVSLEAAWERQTYADGSPDRPRSTAGTIREERRLARLLMTDWLSGRFRWAAEVGVDRWTDGRVEPSLGGGLGYRDLSDRLSLALEASAATSVAGTPSRSYGNAALRAAWRSSTVPRGPVARLRAAGEVVTAAAPLARWPGAGEGRAREGVLRGHPLLDGGVVAGQAFGRMLVHGGVEGQWWFRAPPPLPLAAAVAGFVDVARPWKTRSPESEQLLSGVGFGLRMAVPGRDGRLNADLATPLRDGGWRLEVSWDAPWPGVGGLSPWP